MLVDGRFVVSSSGDGWWGTGTISVDVVVCLAGCSCIQFR